jgi:hypothetical protein
MGTDEVVKAPNQFELFRQVLFATGMAQAATAQISATLSDR